MAFSRVPSNEPQPNSVMFNNDWDLTSIDGNKEVVSQDLLQRITTDICECVKYADVHHIFVVPDSQNVLFAHTIIVGPENTPYEGGFFYFIVKFPNNYPMSPPEVKLMNTEKNSIRFNPQFCTKGRVSLSILSTNKESSWIPSNTLLKVLLSIQSIMNANPFYNLYNLRNYQVQVNPEDTARSYNDYIRHETLRVAVINIMKGDNPDTRLMPSTLRDSIIRVFKLKIPAYFRTIAENDDLNTSQLSDPFNSDVSGCFDYELLEMNMVELAKKHPTDRVTLDNISELFHINFGDEESECSECSDLSDCE